MPGGGCAATSVIPTSRPPTTPLPKLHGRMRFLLSVWFITLACSVMDLVFTLSYGQHWTRRQPDDLCGDAAVKHVLETGTAMGAHDDEISPTLVRHAYDRVRRGPGHDFHLPRAIEAMAHEVTESSHRWARP